MKKYYFRVTLSGVIEADSIGDAESNPLLRVIRYVTAGHPDVDGYSVRIDAVANAGNSLVPVGASPTDTNL